MANQRDIDRWKKGKDHWNKWAQGRLRAKERLEKEGKWEIRKEVWQKECFVDFRSYQFNAVVDFQGFIFPGSANFDNARFRSEASFVETTFVSGAAFRGCRFEDLVQFAEARFIEGDGIFASAEFSGMGNFGGIIFGRIANFNFAQFHNNATFTNSRFEGEAKFHDTYFSTRSEKSKGPRSIYGVEFRNARFLAEAEFHRTYFKDAASFFETRFYKNTSFRSAKSNTAFSLDGTIFTAVPEFSEVQFHSAPRLDNIDVVGAQPMQPVGDRERAARYRALKKIAIEAHDHVREQEFFASELRERRGNDDPVGSLRYILSFIYELLSNFGTSLKRPLMGLFGTWLVMAATYGTVVPTGFRQECGWTTTWMAPEHYLSLLHTLPFVGLVRSGRRELALECLYGSATGFGAGTDVAFIAHNTFAAVLIFLFFLAVRNHFKIK